MEKLIETRGQYDELRYKVGEELRMIQNVKDLLGGDCIKEECNKYCCLIHSFSFQADPCTYSCTHPSQLSL